MKKVLFATQAILLLFFIGVLGATLLQFTGNKNPLKQFNYKDPVYSGKEEFDPALSRLNSLDNLERYCDSLYTTLKTTPSAYQQQYSNLLSAIIRKRFYHGYSYYGFENNFVAVLVARLTRDGYSAIVIPDDILKYPFAACSQQAIVMMEILKRKKIDTRKISFSGVTSGHFGFEVYYDGSWHFFDTNMEPDVNVLYAHNRPGIAYLVDHPEVLLSAYGQYPREEILDIFPTYAYGPVNVYPAPRGILFQKSAKFLSYTLWLFLGLSFLWVRRLYKRTATRNYVRNSRIYLSQPQSAASPAYYPGVTAPGS